eukprot:COSAG01_NODE_1225_length_11135_cov_32.660750_2_plen_67_part_00
MWGSSASSRLKKILLSEIQDVYFGFTSELLRQRFREGMVEVPEWHCFSLVLSDVSCVRLYDVVRNS